MADDWQQAFNGFVYTNTWPQLIRIDTVHAILSLTRHEARRESLTMFISRWTLFARLRSRSGVGCKLQKKLLDTHYDCHDRWVVYVSRSLGRWLNPLGPRGISKMAESEKRSCSQVIMIDDNLKVPICQTYFSEQMIHKLIVKTRESRKGKNFAKVSITSLSNCLNTNEWVGIVNSRYINAWGSIKVTGCKTRSAERIWHMSPLALPQFRVDPVRKKYFKHCENITLLTHNIKSETPGASSHRLSSKLSKAHTYKSLKHDILWG